MRSVSIEHVSAPFFIVCAAVIHVSITLIVMAVFSFFMPEQMPATEAARKITALRFIDAGVITPLLETLVFQTLVFSLFGKIKSMVLPVSSSVLLFVLYHTIARGQVIVSVSVALGGSLLALSYLFWLRRSGSGKATGVTWLIHALHNLTLLSVALFFEHSGEHGWASL